MLVNVMESQAILLMDIGFLVVATARVWSHLYGIHVFWVTGLASTYSSCYQIELR